MDKKKSVLFVCYGLGIGGIEKCMVNLINALPEERYDIDLLVMEQIYDMKPQIRRRVNFLDAFQYTLNAEFTMREIRARGGLWKYREMLWPYIDHRIRIKLGLPEWIRFRPIEKRYDIAVAYSQNGLAPYYVIDKVQADRKVLWYHNGAYTKTKKEYRLDQKYFHQFDYVVGVSEFCASLLREKFGFDDKKLVVLQNICDVKRIRQDAAEFVPDSFSGNCMHITTVGRMSAEKGADLALEVCRMLCAEGRNICWHWVGDGEQAEAIEKRADQWGLHDRFLLEGNQRNPYPYIQNADIYVQPSYYEAYSTTVTEAKVLCRPMVTADVGGMRDQLSEGKNALIVPTEAGAIVRAVKILLDNESMRNEFSEALKRERFDTEAVLTEYERSVFA